MSIMHVVLLEILGVFKKMLQIQNVCAKEEFAAEL